MFFMNSKYWYYNNYRITTNTVNRPDKNPIIDVAIKKRFLFFISYLCIRLYFELTHAAMGKKKVNNITIRNLANI